jgi:hypothetical protein
MKPRNQVLLPQPDPLIRRKTPDGTLAKKMAGAVLQLRFFVSGQLLSTGVEHSELRICDLILAP